MIHQTGRYELMKQDKLRTLLGHTDNQSFKIPHTKTSVGLRSVDLGGHNPFETSHQ